ncbi:MAG: hypothetical protein FIA99_19510 [Ruminiclostridium sp.]|nr:hypothetical protein [Ruminiclostridium sp.]
MNDEIKRFYVSDEIIRKAYDICLRVYENNNDGKHFWVSDFYKHATAIVPDLTFGLMGAATICCDDYIELFEKQIDELAEGQKDDGNLWYNNRAMYQVMYPIWLYKIFIYSGGKEHLEIHRKRLTKAFDYLFHHEDDNGFVKLIRHNEWLYSEGADWVDWCAERMEGKTMVFQTWYYRALLCGSFLMSVLGEDQSAGHYSRKAEMIKKNLNEVYWKRNHYLDNIDFDGQPVDNYWLDTQLWPIVFGVADKSRSMYILNHIECMGDFDEGVPVRWRESLDVSEVLMDNSWRDNGDCTWFGRLGSADILARFKMGQNIYALKLLKRISEIFVRDGNVYECYDMKGNTMPKNIGGGSYLEHAGGYIMSVMEGMFGIEYPVRYGDKLTVNPRFFGETNVWDGMSLEYEAHTEFKYLGKAFAYDYSNAKVEENRFHTKLSIIPKDNTCCESAAVKLSFTHPLPVFTEINRFAVNGIEMPVDNFSGFIGINVEIPFSIDVEYSETLNYSLKGLPAGQANTDSR